MKTLRISIPFGQTFLRSVLFLFFICLAFELFARTPVSRFFFPRESYGTSHPHFEVQLLRLQERVAQGDKIDCIFIGNSQVLYGIDPAAVESAYREQSGRTIRCQNFGLGGLTPLTAGPLARMLIKNFQPSVIVFETGILDYSTSNMEGTNESIMSSPWMRYQLGDFSLDGWLFDHSHGYRLVFGFDRTLKYIEEKDTAIQSNGYVALTGVSGTSFEDQLKFFERSVQELEITERHVAGLRDLLSLHSNQVKIVLIETPTHPDFYAAKRKVRNLYPDFERMLAANAAAVSAPLWLTHDTITIPVNQWHELAHLNEEGAAFFSHQIGLYLASIDILPAQAKP